MQRRQVLEVNQLFADRAPEFFIALVAAELGVVSGHVVHVAGSDTISCGILLIAAHILRRVRIDDALLVI